MKQSIHSNSMIKRLILSVFLSIFISLSVVAQLVNVKTNMLYLATSTPNLGVEFRLSNHTTLSLSGGYNPFNYPSYTRADDSKVNPKLRHWLVMPEFKYWFCRAFERGYVGIHTIYGEYNVGGLSFISALKDYRYQGNAYGGGISAGYQWALGARWGIEASVGAGYLHLHYQKHDCGECGSSLGEYRHNYFGPTKAALSLVYFLK